MGGKAELAYLTKTYGALRFNVPRFLDTCIGTPRKVIGIDRVMDEWMDEWMNTWMNGWMDGWMDG